MGKGRLPSGIGIETCKEKVDIGKTAYLSFYIISCPYKDRDKKGKEISFLFTPAINSHSSFIHFWIVMAGLIRKRNIQS